MDRRNFIKSMLGVAGLAAAATGFASRAEASPLFDDLKAMEALGQDPLGQDSLGAADPADLPALGATDAQYYGPPRRRRRPAYQRPLRRRCRTFVNRRGRLVRRCWVG